MDVCSLLNSIFGVRSSIFSIPYLELFTLYLVLCTIPYFYFVLGTLYLVLLFKLHTHRIDAVPDAAFVRWSIGEAVAQVTSTGRTKDLFSDHEVAVVHVYVNGLWPDGVGKARPSTAAVVFKVRVKNWASTAFAGIDARFFV